MLQIFSVLLKRKAAVYLLSLGYGPIQTQVYEKWHNWIIFSLKFYRISDILPLNLELRGKMYSTF